MPRYGPSPKSGYPGTIVRLMLAVCAMVGGVGCASSRPGVSHAPLPRYNLHVLDDHANYYSRNGLVLFATGFSVGAVIANTRMDEDIRLWYQDEVRSDDTDDFAVTAKLLGEGKYVLPILAGTLLLGELTDHTPAGSVIGDWSDRSLRAALVGAPPMLFMQNATGASRPGEKEGKFSYWRTFDDDNGVSGHAFVGAFPFITAAMMAEDPVLKGGFYFASTLSAWSRVNDDKHYTSQAILGWWMAYMACNAVNATEQQHQNLHFSPVPVGDDGVGFGIVLER